MNLLIMIVIIFYVFALWGMYMFGGIVKADSPLIAINDGIPSDFVLMNFNDLFSSIITLFVLMIVNNWYVIVDMIVMFMDGQTIYRYYFLIFYYFAVIIAVNILMAFAIDIYAVVEKVDDKHEENQTLIYEILMSRHGQHSAFE